MTENDQFYIKLSNSFQFLLAGAPIFNIKVANTSVSQDDRAARRMKRL